MKAKAFKSGYNPSAEASASFSQATISSGLVAYWKFDEGSGTSVADSSGNGNTGTLTSGPVWTAGIAGNALYFDGIDDNVTVLDSNSLDLSGPFTLSAWVNPASTFTDYRSILAKNYKYYLYASSTGFCGDGSPLGGFYEVMDTVVCQPSSLPVNTWSHLTVTYDGSTLTLYRNGITVATASVGRAVRMGCTVDTCLYLTKKTSLLRTSTEDVRRDLRVDNGGGGLGKGERGSWDPFHESHSKCRILHPGSQTATHL